VLLVAWPLATVELPVVVAVAVPVVLVVAPVATDDLPTRESRTVPVFQSRGLPAHNGMERIRTAAIHRDIILPTSGPPRVSNRLPFRKTLMLCIISLRFCAAMERWSGEARYFSKLP